MFFLRSLTISKRSRRRLRTIGVSGCFAVTTACHGILDVSNPTLIQDGDIASASGANGRRLTVVSAVADHYPQIVGDVAVFTDEWTYDTPSLDGPSYDDRTLDLDLRNDTFLLQYDAENDAD